MLRFLVDLTSATLKELHFEHYPQTFSCEEVNGACHHSRRQSVLGLRSNQAQDFGRLDLPELRMIALPSFEPNLGSECVANAKPCIKICTEYNSPHIIYNLAIDESMKAFAIFSAQDDHRDDRRLYRVFCGCGKRTMLYAVVSGLHLPQRSP